uniref:SH2 domain-containing protein n=1 Tax=Periophthalmus magnuspinnatus TaxID=409849 RepID=A0A3B4BKM1_9GOBI
MAQWSQMTQLFQYLSHEMVNDLYPSTFPIDVRHYLAEWIEQQMWWDTISCPQYQQKPTAPEITMDQLVNKVVEIQDIRQKIHVLQEELNLDREKFEAISPQGNSTRYFYDLMKEFLFTIFPLCHSSLVIEKQPPQVIKTQSKFSASVRYLFGDKIAPGKPAMLKVQIINEQQARGVGQGAILEHNTTTKSTSAAFRNMSIKKIKRAERKGSECVTEEKFALLFSGEIHVISVPIVVIVHGSQDINAMATVIWDCAFAEPDRVPFVVPERVPWRQMCNTLNVKFTSEVNTQHSLNDYNLLFLAQRIFDKHDICDFSNMFVSWPQFNKETLPGRSFTFWQWFEGVMELTKKHLLPYWSDRLIFGFIGKQHLHVILKDRPGGTFLLRFSDSEIGAITIAYVAVSETGVAKVQNIMPFSKKDLEISGLGNRIIDINYLTYLYPNIPKNVFKKYYIGKAYHKTKVFIILRYAYACVYRDSNPAQNPVSMMAQYSPNCSDPICM